MTFDDVSRFGQIFLLISLIVGSGLVLWHVLRPSNRSQFDEAARIPLRESGSKDGED